MNSDNLYLSTYESPVGKLFILSLKKGLVLISFSMSEVKNMIKKYYPDYQILKDNQINTKMIKYFNSYFQKKKIDIEIPLFFHGTEFQKKVWLELKEIPYGSTISYKELAGKVGIKKGFQAVGQANSKNPFPILIPCHRVIATDGSLGGYSGGLKKKKILLELEGYQF
jgi:methylated-DNA-[protein]-cysteine S-methyltransferase